MDIGTQGFWRHELRGGYGWIEHVPAVLLKVGPKRLGLAVLKRSGQWVPKWVKPDHFIVKEQ